jgi:hypothetical protein
MTAPLTNQEIQDAIIELQFKLHHKHRDMLMLPLKVIEVQIDFLNKVVIDTLKNIPFPDVEATEHKPLYDELYKLYEEMALYAMLAMIITKRHKI